MLWIVDGKTWYIEVKANAKARMTQAEKRFLDLIQHVAGAEYRVVSDVGLVELILRR